MVGLELELGGCIGRAPHGRRRADQRRWPPTGGCVPLNNTLHLVARAHVFTVVSCGQSLNFFLLYENCVIWTWADDFVKALALWIISSNPPTSSIFTSYISFGIWE